MCNRNHRKFQGHGWTAPWIRVNSVPICSDNGQLTDEVSREPPWTMLFADNIVIYEDTRSEQRLKCWRYALERRGMKVSRSKTEYLYINEGNDEETVKMENTKVSRVKKFKYLGLTVRESASCEKEVKKRVQAG